MFWIKVILVALFGEAVNSNLLTEAKIPKCNEKISLLVRNVMEELNFREPSTHNVAILRLGMFDKQKIEETYEAMINAIPKENLVITPKLRKTSGNVQMRKAAVIIIISDINDPRVLLDHFGLAEKSQYWSNSAKFIFVSTDYFRSRLIHISSFLYSLRALNAIIVGQKRDEIVIYSFNTFEKEPTKRFYKIQANITALEGLFPDKLKDLKGYRYNTISYEEYPFVIIEKENRKLTGTGVRFIETVAKHQNAWFSNRFIRLANAREKIILHSFNKRQVDLTLNTGMMIEGKDAGLFKYVNTLETNGFCALLPYPERKYFFDYFMKPFDFWTWILIMSSVASIAVVWHFLNKYSSVANPNSAGYILFAFVAFFTGQGAEFREHRKMQTLLIQLMVFLTFIFGNLYQSLMISLITESRYGDQITSIQEMVKSNFTFHVDPLFMEMFNKSEYNQELGAKISGTVGAINDMNFGELAREKIVLILSCDAVGLLYLNTGNFTKTIKNAINYYYRMPAKFYSYYAQFPTAPYSPFVERLQEYSLRIHESGVKQHWQALMTFEDMAAVKERENIANEKYLLNFDDLAGTFYIIVIGLAIALAAFLLEIFWFNCLQRLTSKAVARPIRRRFRRRTMRNRVAPHCFIQVQPRV